MSKESPINTGHAMMTSYQTYSSEYVGFNYLYDTEHKMRP